MDSRISNLRLLRSQANAITFNHADRDIFKSELINITDQILAVNYKVDTAPFLPDEFLLSVDIATTWLSLLLNSNAYRLNAEMSFCIEQMIERWNTQVRQKCVVFTVGTYGLIVLKRSLFMDTLNILSHRTGVELSKEPVFVRVPDETKDYMICNLILFHEVGHFVERDSDIAEAVYIELEKQLLKPGSKIIRIFFPRYNGLDISTDNNAKKIIHSFIEEYIADIFGAQYAHEHILCYLSYLKAKTLDKDDDEHPSYLCRYQMVDDFLNSRGDNYLLNAIIQYMPSLNIVHCPFSENDLRDTNLQFADIDQLFCSFASCWRIVLEEACNNGIRRESKENYKEILALPIYNELDANLKRATNDLIRRLYNN